jgi:hypothetical protein
MLCDEIPLKIKHANTSYAGLTALAREPVCIRLNSCDICGCVLAADNHLHMLMREGIPDTASPHAFCHITHVYAVVSKAVG